MIKITLDAYPPPAPVVQKKSDEFLFEFIQNLNGFISEKSSGPKGGQRPQATTTTDVSNLAEKLDENVVLENGSSTVPKNQNNNV